MLCPKCGKGKMILERIEYRGKEIVYIYKCEKCGHRLEIAYRIRKPKLLPNEKWVRWAKTVSPVRW